MEEKRKEKPMKKTVALILCAAVVICLVCSCGARPLPGGFDEAEVKAKAEQIARLLSNGDFEAVAAEFSPIMAERLDAKALEDALGPVLKERGALDKVTSAAVTGMNDETIGDYAAAVLVCRHQNGKTTYTVSIDSEGRICGLYVK